MNEALENLVQEAQQGNKRAMEKIFERFYPFILKNSLHIFIKNYEVEDLIQIGNLSLLKAILAYKKGEKPHFVTFATTAIKNNYYSELRVQMKYKGEYSLDKELTDGFTLKDSLAFEEFVEDGLMEKEEIQALYKVLGEFSIEENDMIDALYFKGMSLPTYVKEKGLNYTKALKNKKLLLQRVRERLSKERQG